MSNDSGAINAASDGTVSTSTSALSGAFNIYSGSTDVTNQATGYGVYAVYNGGGSTLSFIASANDSSAKNIYVVTSIGATLNASFVLSASYAGTIVYKTFTVAKVVAGPKGDTGAGPVYQGAYSSGSVYYYIPGVRADIVLYSGSYYIANNASKSGSAGWGTPGSSSDWTSFGASFSSVATNLLLTQDAVVGRYLNMGGYAGTGSNVTLPNAAIRSYSVSPTISVSRNGGYSTIGITGNGFYLGYPSGTVSTSNNGADAIFFVGDGYGSNSNYMFWNGNNLNLQGNISINPVNNAGVSYGNGIYSGKSGYTDNSNGWWLGVDNDNNAKIYLGNNSNSVKWDGSNLTVTGTVYAGAGSFTGSIYAGAGTIGSWTINSSSITGGSTTINSSGNIYAGQTGYNTGTGWWLGTNGQFSVGNSSGNYLTYSSGTLSVNGTINVTGGNAATQSYADSSASSAASTAYTNAKAVADSIANGSYSGGTLISGKSVISPIIAGYSGYFSGSMTVGSSSPITLDGANSRIVIAGTGGNTYSTAKFYVGSDGKFGIGQGQVTWDNTTLTVNGTVNATAGYLINGKLASSSGGWNVGSTGQITAGSITLDGSTPYIGIGTTSYNGTGIWMGNSSGTYKFSVGNGSSNYMTWDGSALKVSGDIESTTGHIGGWTIGSSTLYSGNVSLDSGADTITINTGGSSKAVLETATGHARVKVTNTSGNMTGYLQGTYGSGVLDVGALVLLDGSGNSNSVILGSGYATFAGTATAAAFNTTSSRKLKKNIAPITNALAKVIKLQGVTFDWNNKELNNDFGLIAEDVNEVLPTIVGKSETGDVTGVDYGRITALLIETVKELNNKIEVLESKLNNA